SSLRSTFFCQAEDGIRGGHVTGVQTCALPISKTAMLRMTVWYATALILSIAVFAIVLYFGRRSASYQDLDRRIQSEADLTAGIRSEERRVGKEWGFLGRLHPATGRVQGLSLRV